MTKNGVYKSAAKYLLATLLTLSFLTSCGFKLRGDYLLPEELKTLYVSADDTHGELSRLVKHHLTINDVNLVSNSNEQVPELHLLKDTLDRSTLSLFENGQVAEYDLTYTVRYEILFADRDKQLFQFKLHRNYQDNPNQALAKSRELTLLLKEMRIEAATKILRNLASTHL